MIADLKPWAELSTPRSTSDIVAKRVSASVRWNFYWAIDDSRHRLLVMRHSLVTPPAVELPHLRGVDVVLDPARGGSSASLVLRLVDSALEDIFAELCLDIVKSCELCRTEQEAFVTTVQRTWRWHHLLRGGFTGKLSVERQMGLIGELWVIDRILLSQLSPSATIDSWRGPLGHAKDFELGSCSIEAKAVTPARMTSVKISSEHQLDLSDCTQLFLHVLHLEVASGPTDEGFSLHDFAEELRTRILVADRESSLRFDALLTAAGYSADTDYSDSRWKVSGSVVAHVRDGFPAIAPTNLPTGVTRVRYELSLAAIAGFAVSVDVISDLLGGNPT